MKILIVEDDELIAQTLENVLREHDYIVDRATEGQLGWEFVETYDYDLIVLDIVLPKLNGIEFCQRLRSAGNQTPVMLLTAQNSNNKKVVGLDAGADDYVVKPFEITELLARIRVLLRRKNSLLSPILQWGKLKLNSSTHVVTYNEKNLNLTPKEYRLLELFLHNGDRVLTRENILDRLWDVEEAPSENTICAHIKVLRRKLKQAGANCDPIETVYGVGYRLKPVAKLEEKKNEPKSKKLLRQQTTKALTAVWHKFEGINSDRLEILERANLAWQENTLEGNLLQQAQRTAHKLAGGLGIFGFAEGSNLAREIEQLLKIQATSEPVKAKQFNELLTDLKNSIQPNPNLKSPSAKGNRPVIIAVDRHPKLVKKIIAQMTAAELCFELVTTPVKLKQALAKPNLEAVVWQFSLTKLTEPSLKNLARVINDLPSPVILFTDRNDFQNLQKTIALGNNLLLQHSSLSDRAVTAIVKAIARLRNQTGKILAVDDDPEVLTAISSLLDPWQIDVTTLSNPLDFWQIITELKPDLLLLDVAMPNYTGIELCQLARNDPRWRELPILFFTVHNDLNTIHQALTVGANDFINKTSASSELIPKIFNHLNRSQLLRAI
ncbi:response regulator [Pleurocapsales cyanobacterium LEGE 10410]|nr:response regulator [Pleurocapsales cyanobacterium LEGE 10410]